MVIIDLYIEQGSNFSQDIVLGEDHTGDTITGSIIDSGGTIKSGIVSAFTNEATGAFTIGLSSLQTADMSVGVAKYDIEITSGTVVTKPIKGVAYVSGEVTV